MTNPVPYDYDESVDAVLLAVQRTGAAFGLTTIVIVALAYALVRRLRSEVATLVMLISISYALGSISLLVMHGDIHHGDLSLWYQAQGFLFDVFGLSSATWSLIFAIHTLLIFSRGPKQKYLRKWGWVYAGLSYGPAFGIAVGHTHFKKMKYAETRNNLTPEQLELLSDKVKEIPFQLLTGIWGCIVASMIVYAAIGILILLERRDKRRREQETLDAEKRKKHSILSLSGWPVSPGGVSMFLKSQRESGSTFITDSEDDNITSPSRPRPVSYPPPRLSSTSAPEPTWLTTFAEHPRAAPPPPEVLPTEDPKRRVYFRVGLLITFSLVVSWFPGTSNLTWRALNPDQDTPICILILNAVLFNFHGVWIGVIFFLGIGGWRDVKDVWVSGRLKPRNVMRSLQEKGSRKRRRDKGKSVETWDGMMMEYGGTELDASPSSCSPHYYPSFPPRTHSGRYSHRYSHITEPKELEATQSPSSQSAYSWDFVDIGLPRGFNNTGVSWQMGQGSVMPRSPPPGYI